MIPNSKATFKEYCLRKLGKPVIDIEIDEDQLDDRVDEALRFYYDYHFDGAEKVYVKHAITADDITNRYIQMADNVFGVVEIFPIGNMMQYNNMFSIKYQMAMNDLYSLTGTSMIPYYQYMSHLALLEELLVGKQPIRYNRNSNLLYLDMSWDKVEVGEYIVIVAYQVVDPNTYVRTWGERLLQELATALIKEQWASHLTKFKGIPMNGGMMFNGEQILADAQRDIIRIKQEIRDSSLPVSDMIG